MWSYSGHTVFLPCILPAVMLVSLFAVILEHFTNHHVWFDLSATCPHYYYILPVITVAEICAGIVSGVDSELLKLH